MPEEKNPTASDDAGERKAEATEESKKPEESKKSEETQESKATLERGPRKLKKKNSGKQKAKLTKEQLKAKAKAERLAKKDAEEAQEAARAKKQKGEEKAKQDARGDRLADAAEVRNEKLENREKSRAAANKQRKEAADLRSKADAIDAELESPQYSKPVFEDDDTDEYWVGAMAGSPLQNITVGGMSFSRTTDKVTTGKGIRTLRSSAPGGIVVMTYERVEAVKQAIRDRALRPGNPPIKINLKKKKLRRTDRPMGDFVYLMTTDAAADKYGARWRENAPDCFSKTDKE